MLVYRVEHKDNGRGPFMNDDGSPFDIEVRNNYFTNPEYPSPYRDGIDFWCGEDHCGCRSLQELQHWFYDQVESLEENGYVVSVYDIDPDYVKEGKRQVAFPRFGDALVETLPASCLTILL